MKKNNLIVILLLVGLLTAIKSTAQPSNQKFTITCTSENIVFSTNSPTSLSDLKPKIGFSIKIITETFNDLKQISIKGLTPDQITTLNHDDLKSIANSQNNFTIQVKADNTIKGFDKTKKIPFPFQLEVVYHGITKLNEGGPIGTDTSINVNTGNNESNTGTGNKIFYNIPYYDALEISILFKKADYKNLISLMSNYFPNIKSVDNLKNAVKNNNFLKDIFNQIDSTHSSITTSSDFSPFSLSSLGNLDVTNLVDGFAKFLVKRNKEELSVVFFDRFNKFITDDKYKDARILFPQTYAILQSIGTEIYNYQAYINGLREAFEKDLDGLLTNLPNVINDDRYKTFFDKHPDIKAICLSALDIGNSLITKVHPGKIIEGYNVSMLDSIPNAKAAVQIFKIFSASLKSANTDHYWISPDSLELLIKDDIAFKAYLGLIYEQSDGIVFKKDNFIKDSTFRQLLNNSDSVITAFSSTSKQYYTYIRALIKQAATVSQNINNIEGKDVDKLTFTDYFSLYNSALDLIGDASLAYQLPGLSSLKPNNNFSEYLNIAKIGGQIALDINRKNYSSAIVNTYTLYNYAAGGNVATLDKLIKPGSPDSLYAVRLKADIDTLNKTNNINEFKSKLLQFGTFMATIVQAQSSDDVAAAIEAAALPSGSSRIKRETPFNVAVNAYTGLFAGYEKIKGIDNHCWQFNSYGVAAPIGVAVSWGHHAVIPTGGWTSNKYGWSTSLFVSVIDIGALAAFRFTNDSTIIKNNNNTSDTLITSASPSIQLKNIISPGAFLSIGIPKSPLSVNFGAQLGVNLRQVTSTNNTVQLNYSNNTYWRFSVSLCVDIPIFNLYTTSK